MTGEWKVDAFEPGAAPHNALWETIAATLRRAIVLGELTSGLHLEEPTLAEKFGVSRIPVREALTRLAHEGLIRLEPRRGAFVVGVTEADVHDVYELRRLIELHAIREAAQRIGAAGIAQLRVLTAEMENAVRIGNLQQIAAPDVSFHRQIVIHAGNRRLLAAWEPIAGLVATILTITDTTYRDMPRAVASHQSLVNALEQRDGETAARELAEHLSNGEDVMREAMLRVHSAADLDSVLC